MAKPRKHAPPATRNRKGIDRLDLDDVAHDRQLSQRLLAIRSASPAPRRAAMTRAMAPARGGGPVARWKPAHSLAVALVRATSPFGLIACLQPLGHLSGQSAQST